MVRRTAVAIALLVPAAALADTVVLKNGRRIEGRVVQDTGREVLIETRGTIMTIDRKQVASIEKDAQTPATVKPGVPEDLGVPDGASDEEVERLRALVPQLRETARRWLDAKAERERAERSDEKKDLQYLKDKEQALAKQLDSLKEARDAIEKSAADRLSKSQRAARGEADQLRADTEKLKNAYDAPGLADRAEKLHARIPENPRDPRHGPLLAEALYAMECSGDVDEKSARSATSADVKIAGLMRAAERFAWCIEYDGAGGEAYFKRAVAAYSEAHRAAGFETRAIERALMNLMAYRACAALVEDRLGERRWGADVAENEAGQYRLDFKDRAPAYGNDPPAQKDLKSARERRDRTENRSQPDGKGGTQTILVKATRWYELFYDAQKKRWVRDSAVTDLESKKLVPLLREAQDKADALAASKKELALANKAASDRRDALNAVRRKAEQADATEEALDKAQREASEQAKLIGVSQDGVAQAQAALGVKQRELVELDKEIERTRKGE